VPELDESTVRCRERYGAQIALAFVSGLLADIDKVRPVHRTDYHEDGSQTECYYLDLTEEQYRRLVRTED
jgi:hypothetical protein